MIEYIVLFIILFVFVIASLEDIKKREVYDYINFSLAFIILIIGVFDSINIGSINPIKYVGFGFLIGYLIGAFMFYAGVWGGGDTKFLLGFGASSYYLMKFIDFDDGVSVLYNSFLNLINIGFKMFVDFFVKYIVMLDIVFLILIVFMFFSFFNRQDVKNLINLFLILFLLFLGLEFDYSQLMLIIFGLVAVLLIFFGYEEVFSSVYFKIKKRIIYLNETDRIDTSITKNGKEIVSFNDGHLGLIKEDLIKIKDAKFTKNEYINIRKVLPYSILIGLNYIVYMIKIVTLDDVNLKILAFMFKFLFYSFLVGGVIAILFLLYFFIKNYKKVNIRFSEIEKYGLSSVSLVIILIGIFDARFFWFLGFVFVVLFLKIARSIESMILVSKKNVNDVVFGDWVVQDIVVDGKIIYSKEDFKLGIEEKQLEKIRKLAKKHKELGSIYVKDGLAFLPPLFIGFIIIMLI